MWTCPRCGYRFVSANSWHSCSRIDIDELFARSLPNVRACFDRFVELLERCGPIEVIPQKTRIAIMADVRFAGGQVRRDRFLATFALGRRVDHPLLVGHEDYGPRWIVHRLALHDPAQLDDAALAELVCESYRDLGLRGSLTRGRTERCGGRPAATSGLRSRPG